MVAPFFRLQLDYIYFVYGVIFVLLGVVCLLLVRDKKQQLPWIYLTAFAFIGGLYEWLSCVSLSIATSNINSVIQFSLMTVSFIFLLEFGRVGLKNITGKGPGRWIHIPLLLCVGLGALAGLDGLNAASRYIYGLGGGIWAALAFWQASKTAKSRMLLLVALCLAGYAICIGVIVPKAGFFPAFWINQDVFFTASGVPIQFFRCLLTMGMTFGIWKYDQMARQVLLYEELGKQKNFFGLQFILLFAALITAGWGFTEYAGKQADQNLRQDLTNQTELTRVAINETEFKSLSGKATDFHLAEYASLRQKLIAIQNTDSSLQDVYLMIMKSGKIYFALDSLPLTNPGAAYNEPPLPLYDVFFSGNTHVVGPYSDEYGSFVSGFTSIQDGATGNIIGAVGIDIKAADYQLEIARYRLAAISITLLLFLIIIGFFSFRQTTLESAQRIAASQKNLATAQTVAQFGSWTWGLLSNQFSWSDEMYQIFGQPSDGKLLSFADFRKFFMPEDWKVFNSTVQHAIQEGHDFEQESQIFKTDTGLRHILTRGMLKYGEDGKPVQLVGICQDVTRRKLAYEQIRKLSQAIEQSPVAIVITNLEGNIEYVNPKFSGVTGYSLQEAIGRNPRILKSGETSQQEYAILWNTIQSGKAWTGEFHNKKKNGELYWEAAVISPILDENERIINYLAVKEDITELKLASDELRRIHEELKKTNLELEQASQVKSQFLANMSHEIRTPLNAIIGMTSLLLDTPLTSEQHNFADTVRTSSEVLLSLINDILDFSKIEAQKMELEEQSFDLRHCIEEALDLINTRASEKKLELAYSIADDLPVFMVGDVTRLRQILVNLLSNAVKFTDAGEVFVSVSGQRRDKNSYQLHFKVHDTGLGIPPDRVDRLFQSFSQVDASTTRRFGGTGLGLAISKRLSELMGGSMWVESAGIPGQGSTFHFTIQAKEASDQNPEPGSPAPVDLIGLKILIVDDHKTNRDILVHYLESWKIIPTALASAQEALQLLREQASFDLAILDLQMPDMDGLSLAKQIYDLLQDKAFPMILLSSLGYHETKSDESYFTACLTKPIKPSLLFDSLEGALNKKSTPQKKKFRTPETSFERDLGQRHPLRILVAEDNSVNQHVALSLLARIGYRADVACNGIEALDALKRQPYDLVFMDGQMPEMDGEEAARSIRKDLPPEEQPRIVAMTANAMRGDRERYLSAGMDDYISKPIRIEDLVCALNSTHPIENHPANIQSPSAETGQPVSSGQASQADFSPSLADKNSAEGSQPLNPAMLQEFQELMGDDGPAMVEDLIKLYLANSLTLINQIQQALKAADYDGLRRAAHTLKGNSYQVGAMLLGDQCSELEKIAKAGSGAGAEELIKQIQADFQSVKVSLNLVIDPSNA